MCCSYVFFRLESKWVIENLDFLFYFIWIYKHACMYYVIFFVLDQLEDLHLLVFRVFLGFCFSLEIFLFYTYFGFKSMWWAFVDLFVLNNVLQYFLLENII